MLAKAAHSAFNMAAVAGYRFVKYQLSYLLNGHLYWSLAVMNSCNALSLCRKLGKGKERIRMLSWYECVS